MSQSAERTREESEFQDGTFCPTDVPVGRIGPSNPDFPLYKAGILSAFAAAGIAAALVTFGP